MSHANWEKLELYEQETTACKANAGVELCPERLLFDVRNGCWLLETIQCPARHFRRKCPRGGQDRRHAIRHGPEHVLQERPRRFPVGFPDALNNRKFAGSVMSAKR
jgi:hypothetical protein